MPCCSRWVEGEFRRIRFFWIPLWFVLLICGGRALLAAVTNAESIELYPMAMELKPFLYLLFTFVWVNRFGVPSAQDFVRAGTYLSAIVVSECLMESLITQRFARPLVRERSITMPAFYCCRSRLPSTESNGADSCYSLEWEYSAAFLVLRKLRPLFWLCFPAGSNLVGKFSVATAGLLGLAASFRVRSITAADISAGDRFYMWNAAIRLFAHDPLGFLLGYRLGVPLGLTVPRQLQTLWGAQAHSIREHGVFAYNFHSMWIRLIISWGAVTVLPLIAMLLFWMFNKRHRLARSVVIVILIEGFTMGVFYLSNVAIPVLLFMLLAASLAKTEPASWIACQ